MPTLGEVTRTLAPVAGAGLDYLTRRRTLNNATNTVNQGATEAGRRITDATGRAIGRQDAALDTQRGLMDDSVAAQEPYAATGRTALGLYDDLLKNPADFDPNQYQNEAGVKFALDQAFKATDRQFRASGQQASGGQVRRQQRSALDEANRLYQDAFNRFMATQQERKDTIRGGVGIGQDANAAADAARNRYGDDVGANANATGSLDVNAAEDLAALDLAKSQATATNQTLGGNNTSNTIGKLLEAAPGLLQTLAPGLAAKIGLGAGSAAAGLAGGVAVPSLAAVNSTLGGMAGVGIGSPAAAASTAAAGGLGSTLTALATNPITIGVAGALAAGAIWLKSQAHWEANTAVKNFENPFHEQTLKPFAAEWDQAIKSGKMTAQQGQQSLQQYTQNFEDYIDRIEAWGKKGDKAQVAQQSINNLWKTTVKPQIDRMTREIAGLAA